MEILHLVEGYMHDILVVIADYSILIFEFIGVFILIATGIKGTYSYITKDPLTRLNLARGMAMGLEFKLGSEILRTVIVREFSEIILVGAIIVLRGALTFLIHWEIKTEEEHIILEAENEMHRHHLKKSDHKKDKE